MGFFRPTFAEINLDALVRNYHAARSILPDGAGIMAMVKADAYGHGAVRVSEALAREGVGSLGVATVEEGLELRESGIKLPVIVMGGLMGMGSPASGMMVGADLTPVVHSTEVLEFLEAVARAAGKIIGIHLKVDSGMSRLGALPKALDKLLDNLKDCRHIRLDGVMTHLANAEDVEYTKYQMDVFDEASKKIGAAMGPVKIWHVANSAAMIDGNFLNSQNGRQIWVRPGLMLFGAYPTPGHMDKVSLTPVMSIKSTVALMKTVAEGTKVSYGCTYTTKRKTRIGVIPIGYADGYPWSLSNKAEVLISGRRVPVIGRVTMDMIMVDVTDIENCHVGDRVVLMGRQGKEEIGVCELARLAGSIPYEFFCGISKRMPRIYTDSETEI